MELIKYRDVGVHTYTWFWTQGSQIVSPYFSSEREAQEWLDNLQIKE